MTQTALLMGGTGLVGQSLLGLLVDDDHWDSIVVVSRRALRSTSDKVVEVISGPGQLESVADQLAVDTVFCCLGTTMKNAGSRENFRRIDYDYVLESARVAHLQGATRFIVVTALDARLRSPSFYMRVKAETERDLTAIGFDALDIVRPSLILGERDERRPVEEWSERILNPLSGLMIGPLRRYRPIPASQIAKAMAAIARIPGRAVTAYDSDRLLTF
ncbi:MAG: NAD(P)H-binding protein [Pseudomonadota bacterium]